MSYISTINGSTRKIYLSTDNVVGGVLSFHPVDDLYPEYKALRANNETTRPYNALVSAEGNKPKGRGKFTPRYLLMLESSKIVIPNGVSRLEITGELLTDDETDPLDISLVTGICIIDYKPSEAEVIKVLAGGNEYSLNEIASASSSAVWGANPASFIAGSIGELVKKLYNLCKNIFSLSA